MPDRTRLIVLLLAFLAFLPAAAVAQTSDAQLRKENERLREENHRLQFQLDDLRLRVEALEAQIAALTQAIETLQQGEGLAAPADAADKSPLPDDPLAAPDALFAYLEKAYEEALGDVPRKTDDELARYQRLAELWVGRMNRELRGEVEWFVLPFETRSAPGSDLSVDLQVLDADTLEPIGEVFPVLMPIRTLRRAVENGRGKGDRLMLTAHFAAKLAYDEERDVQGMFNDPPFLAPYVIYDYELIIRSLEVVGPEPADPPADQE
jgi:hypothetical protein